MLKQQGKTGQDSELHSNTMTSDELGHESAVLGQSQIVINLNENKLVTVINSSPNKVQYQTPVKTLDKTLKDQSSQNYSGHSADGIPMEQVDIQVKLLNRHLETKQKLFNDNEVASPAKKEVIPQRQIVYANQLSNLV